ncbi:MAG: site-2 protease family protein [archaeon]|nr:site-2 protease family protein [archaeon]
MNTTHVILMALVAIYVPLYICVRKKDRSRERGPVTYGPAIIIKTKTGICLIRKLARFKRFWKICGLFSRVVAIVLMFCVVSILVINLSLISEIASVEGVGIEYALVIPGINPMLPLTYGWIALIVALIVHEVAHGIQTEANDMEVKSTGLIYAVIPVGAFVEPNGEHVKKCSRGVKIDLYAAGITANFITSLISFLVLFLLMSTTVTEYKDSPAVLSLQSSTCECEIPTSAIITKVNGHNISNYREFINEINPSEIHGVTYIYKDKEETRDIRLGIYVENVIDDSPAFDKLKKGDFIEKIENISNGTSESFKALDGFMGFMGSTSPGDQIRITCLRDGDHRSIELCLGGKDGIGYIGILPSFSGYLWITPEILLGMGTNPCYNCNTLGEFGYTTLSYIGNALHGLSPVPEATQWWFHSNITDDVFWVVVQIIYWIFWLNIAIGITNAIPAMPFDGGFLFTGGIDWIAEKIGVKDEVKREAIVSTISAGVTYVMLLTLFVVMIAFIF